MTAATSLSAVHLVLEKKWRPLTTCSAFPTKQETENIWPATGDLQAAMADVLSSFFEMDLMRSNLNDFGRRQCRARGSRLFKATASCEAHSARWIGPRRTGDQ